MSLILVLVLISFSIEKLYFLFGRINPNVNKNTLVRDTSYEYPYRPSDFGFDFSFGLSNNSQLDPSYGYFTLTSVNSELSGNGKKNKTYTSMPFSQCSSITFNYSNWAEV